MTIILAIWAAAAIAGTVTAVVLTRKRKRPVAICDTCEYLQIRNDHNDPKDGTTWFCSYGRGHRFTDPPEYCKMYQPRSMCTYQDRQEISHSSIIMSNATAQRLINEGAYANLQTMVNECNVLPESLQPHYANTETAHTPQYVWET